MRWNLRLAAANRGIWKASELQRMLAERGLVISAGKMSGLWSGDPASIKLSDLDVICAVLGCGVEELLIPEPDKVKQPEEQGDQPTAASSSSDGPGDPKRRDGRSLPPVWCPHGRSGEPCPAAWTAWPGVCWAGAAARRARYGGTITPARPRVQGESGARGQGPLLPIVLAAGRHESKLAGDCRGARSRCCKPAGG